MATRGWTSRAASSDPAGVPGPVDGELPDVGLGAPVLEGAVDVARVHGQPVSGGEHLAGVDPEGAGPRSGFVLQLLLEAQGGHADVGQREEGAGGLGLGLAVDQTTPDPLEPESHLELCAVEVHHRPGQAPEPLLAGGQGRG